MLLGDLDGPYFQRFFVDAYVDLAPTSRDHAVHNPGGQWMRRLGPPCLRAFLSPSPSTAQQTHPQDAVERGP